VKYLALILLLCMGDIIEAATVRESLMYGPENTRGAFLLRGMGARAVGMGEAFTAVADDATAISWNPGGLGQLNSPEVIAMYDVVGPGVGRLGTCPAAKKPD